MVVNTANAEATLNAASSAIKTARAAMRQSSFAPLFLQCVGLADGNRRDLAIEPILLQRKRTPSLRHTPVTPEGRLTVCPLGEVKAVLCIFSKEI